MNLKKLERYLRINLLGPGPHFIKKDLLGCGITKVEKHWCIPSAARMPHVLGSENKVLGIILLPYFCRLPRSNYRAE
jgi:hypothetical protein